MRHFQTLLLLFAITLPASAGQAVSLSLSTWYSPSRGDYFTTSDPRWQGRPGDRRHPDYVFVRTEGRLFSPSAPQPANTKALYSWWSAERGDNFITADPAWQGKPGQVRNGYTCVRVEGYVLATRGTNSLPLRSWWNRDVKDNAASADPRLG